MSFGIGYSSRTDIDFGETSLENIFIKHFLPFATEQQLKVYIAGLFYAKNLPGADLESLPELLSMSEEEIISALEYWEKCGLISIEKTDRGDAHTDAAGNAPTRSRLFSDRSFHIKFHSARSQIFNGLRKINTAPDRTEKLAALLTSIKKKPLSSAEYAYYEDFAARYDGDLDLLETVLTLYYIDLGGSEFSEVRKFLDALLQSGERDIEQTAISARNYFLRNRFYKRVKLLIGGKAASTPAEQTMINNWIDGCKLSENQILRFIEEHSPDTNNPTVGFINKLILQKYRDPDEDELKDALYARLKLEITGSRYAVNKSEKRIMAAWFDELGMSESDVDASIAKYSPAQRGATVGYIDEKIRGTLSEEPSRAAKTTLKVRNKKTKAEPFQDSELEKRLLERKNKNRAAESNDAK